MWMRRHPLPWTLTAMNHVRTLYAAGGELGRMRQARNGVEWLRTCELLARWLPPAPAVVADVGGGPGDQALWLRQDGYQVRHFDLTPLHVQVALRHGLDAQIADARNVPLLAATADAVLLLGPL
jgi:2-polyprenyl-3-methyl-5-hydroxy-6-metoxy-1,4-benzoquinol methylase